jgi:hypothetical protein
VKYGQRVGLTEERLDRVAASVRRGGLLGIGLAVLTPGVRSAVVPACGLTGIAWRLFLPGLALGSAIDLGLHFAIGYAGSGILATIAQPSPLLVVVVLGLLGLAAWFLIARRRHASMAVAVNAWAQATCPVCLILGSVAPLEAGEVVRGKTSDGYRSAMLTMCSISSGSSPPPCEPWRARARTSSSRTSSCAINTPS